ncbi:MAG TPA: ATPase domain-containing protein [Thermoplasmata archaeon]|nr:ATPase domain-containing protein [Thermoplasmata archaeon]
MPPIDIGDRLRALPLGSAVALKLDPREYADHYFAVLNATLRGVGAESANHTVYVAVTNPASFVWSLAQALDVTPDQISFVDAISHLMMNYSNPLENATYVESPRALEEIMLRVEYLLRRYPHPRTTVVIDSVNSLAIHNPPELLSEFFHILLNNLKSRQVLTLVLETTDEEAAAIDQMLNLVVDETIDVARAGR